nr:MAG TPA: hypothetical protein [Caudoviricetes sp.]
MSVRVKPFDFASFFKSILIKTITSLYLEYTTTRT